MLNSRILAAPTAPEAGSRKNNTLLPARPWIDESFPW